MVIQMKRSLTLLLGLALLAPFARPSEHEFGERDRPGPERRRGPNATGSLVENAGDRCIADHPNERAGVYFFPGSIAGSTGYQSTSPGMERISRRFHCP